MCVTARACPAPPVAARGCGVPHAVRAEGPASPFSRTEAQSPAAQQAALRRREEGARLRGPGGAGAAHRALRGMHPREQVREIPGRVTPGGRGLPTAV